MSMAEATAIESPAAGPGPAAGRGARSRHARAWLRFFRLRAAAGLPAPAQPALLGVVALLPDPASASGCGSHRTRAAAAAAAAGGLSFVTQLTGNGMFLSLHRPDHPAHPGAAAGRSPWSPVTRSPARPGTGTLRYLLAVPAGRTRLLAVKYARHRHLRARACTFVVTGVALIIGAVAVPDRPGDAAVRHHGVAGRRHAAAGVRHACTWPRRWPRSARSAWPSRP